MNAVFKHRKWIIETFNKKSPNTANIEGCWTIPPDVVYNGLKIALKSQIKGIVQRRPWYDKHILVVDVPEHRNNKSKHHAQIHLSVKQKANMNWETFSEELKTVVDDVLFLSLNQRG